ncbi:MAG TPA: NAD(P)-dependent alcohol dehydrogenase [Pseudomonadota bacterium]|jgi:NADPH:quinone reductase-like Zn-dependent oxidoreductase|nr:NAD(P)-dependent alcohol dehydrogenase [Pseudomonadota bacterium]HNF98005.1 NAD(P)-dependent alcohol dehydrogenase [Pseudomonadota bacterium]HNI58452.1 NAD(P)-dependent alcohol dehydrogenase [Pseudomonadota bacterium]HNK43150.1 NAD(P)-dependent alcohol dehydrogenase [Pseudomonadota bacterium]HNO67153.1 NAD(P)-dependent alcohol dehydrogenase [Pseudomonadota bacterium]
MNMHAVVLPSVGPPEVLRFLERPRPTPGRGMVLVEMRATTVSPLDCQERAGQVSRLIPGGRPEILGHDVCGIIAAIGEGVSKLTVGTEVIGLRALQNPGTYAEFVTLPADAVTRKPMKLSFEAAAALPLSGTVALQAIRDRGRLQGGQALLVNGAAGGIGSLAVQLGKALGAVVTGVCSGDSSELVASLGADEVIDFEKEDLATLTGTFDVVLDTSGQLTLDRCRKMLRPKGRFIPIVPSLRTLLDSVTSRFFGGPQTVPPPLAQPRRADLELLAELADQSKLRPIIDRVFPLAEAAAAHRHVEEGRPRGRVVLCIGSEKTPPKTQR